MIIKTKEQTPDYPDITFGNQYFVIGIEAGDYRILNDFGKPYLYPSNLFDVVDSKEPEIWVNEYGTDGERYSYPPVLNEAGFFEDYFEGKESAVSKFWHIINKQLAEAA
jgi:hypothetical protein